MTSDIHRRYTTIALIGMALLLCGGCAGPNNPDPLEKLNRFFYGFNDGFDRFALKPAADVYKAVLPAPVRTGIGNGFNNLTYFDVVFNDLLQKKNHQAMHDFGRFAINSTLGVGGILDIATPWGLPSHDNDFGVTLGKWGCGPGPYIVVPVFGPDDLRDCIAPVTTTLCTALTWIDLPKAVTIPLSVTDAIQARARSDFLFQFRSQAAVDPYVFTREAYLQYRQGKIQEGKPTVLQQQNLYDEDMDSGPPATQPSTKPSP